MIWVYFAAYLGLRRGFHRTGGTGAACGATLVCEAVLIDALGIKWGDLRGDCR